MYQLWKNEKDRLEVLSEKHRRGAAARTIRAMRKTKAVTKTNKSLTYKGNLYCKLDGVSRCILLLFLLQGASSSTLVSIFCLVIGVKHCKHFHHLGSSRTRETTRAKKNCLNELKELAKNKKRVCSQSFTPFSSKQNGGFKGSAYRRRYQNLIQSNQVREIPCLPYSYPSQTFNHFQSDVFPTELRNFHSHRGSASTAGLPYSHPLPYSAMKPISEWKEFSHGSSIDPGYSHSKNGNEAKRINCFPRLMDNRPSFHSTTDRHISR